MEEVYFETADGSRIYVEVESASDEDLLISDDGGVVKKAAKKFSDVLDTIKGIAEESYTAVSGIPSRPDEVTLEFGLKITGSLNAYIASTSGEAHLKVALKWSHKKD